MRVFANRRTGALTTAILGTAIFILYYSNDSRSWILPAALPEVAVEHTASAPSHSTGPIVSPTTSATKPASTWSRLQQHYPVHSTLALPSGNPGTIPKIQHVFTEREIAEVTNIQRERRSAVKEVFEHAWQGYKGHAWLKDEVSPISGNPRNSFGGLAATLVDSLDSLWILGLREEFEDAVEAVGRISFGSSGEKTVNLFEYTIRYLGGLLGAFEVSDRKFPVLLDKAIEVGDMLYAAFDTPNRMPLTHWEWKSSLEGERIQASNNTNVAELGSLSLEFTTLSRLSKDSKYYDAIQRITEELQKAQNNTQLLGMWPVFVDARTPSFSGHNSFTLGAMSDSLYEYLPKVRLPSISYDIMTEFVTATPVARWCDFSVPQNV